MSSWAPLVHGRTAHVDFRPNLIVVPEGFTSADIEWAKNHILATTRVLERADGPLWSVFTNRRYGVVGVTCWASDVSREKTLDHSRRLYVFLGYVHLLPLPGMPQREIEEFKSLYKFVEERWEERIYDSRGLRTQPFGRELALARLSASTVELNTDWRRLKVWPAGHDDPLWSAACRAEEASLCLGMPQAKDAQASPFWNATAMDVESPRVLERSGAARQDETGTALSEPATSRRERLPSTASSRIPAQAPRESPHSPSLPDILRDLLSLIFVCLEAVVEGLLGPRKHRPDASPRPAGVPAGFRFKAPATGGTRREFEPAEPVLAAGPPASHTDLSPEEPSRARPQERLAADARPQNGPPPGFRAPARPRERKKGRWEGW